MEIDPERITWPDLRVYSPKPRLGSSTRSIVLQEGPPRRPVETTRVVIAVWRACADCFRSQLRRLGFGRFARRDPNEAVRTYHEGFQATLKIGTFYLARSRNFLFGSDTGIHAAMMVHPAPFDMLRAKIIAASMFEVHCTGKESHASAFPERGVNAADALTIAQRLWCKRAFTRR